MDGTDKYDHRYTGIHDHGVLPALRTGGPHEKLVNGLLVSWAMIESCTAVLGSIDSVTLDP